MLVLRVGYSLGIVLDNRLIGSVVWAESDGVVSLFLFLMIKLIVLLDVVLGIGLSRDGRHKGGNHLKSKKENVVHRLSSVRR